MEHDLETLGGFTQMMKSSKRQPSTKVMTQARRKADGKYAMLFGIAPEDTIYYIRQICYADGEPISLEEIFVPEKIVPKLEGIDLSVFSLDEVYNFYGVTIQYARQTLDLTKLEPKDARLLELEECADVFLLECTSYDQYDHPVEFSRTYTRGDKCNFTVTYHK